MRSRAIKPGFFKNEQLADCSLAARLLYPGLWMLADRKGRLEYRPKRWKGEIFPYDNIDTEALFEELEAQGLVVRYGINGTTLVWIPHFLDHQNPHRNEQQSALPPHPDDHFDDNFNDQGDSLEQPRKEESTTKVVPCNDQGDCEEQPWNNPIGLTPDSSLLERREKTGCVLNARPHVASPVPEKRDADSPKLSPLPESPERTSTPKRTDCPSKGGPEWAGFQSCFDVYPVQQGKEPAWREWMRLHGNGTLAATWEIRDAILTLKAEDIRWKRGMAPKMAKWLNEKGWDDRPYSEPVETARASPQSPRQLTPAQEKRLLTAQTSQDALRGREAFRNDPQNPYRNGIGSNVRSLPPATA